MAKQKKDNKAVTCVTPEFRVAFPAVLTPKAYGDQDPKYSVRMLFPKKTDLKALKTVVDKAIIAEYGSVKKVPKNFKLPFHDGNEKQDYKGHKGHIYVNADSNYQPMVVDSDHAEILNEKDFYPGCYAKAEITAACFDVTGNVGVKFYLQSVKKTRDGETFVEKRNPDKIFGEAEGDDSDDESNYEEESEESPDDSDEDEYDLG